MIRYILMLCIGFASLSCKKLKENVEEKAVLTFITSGQWRVANLTKGDSSFTADFASYKFQFKSDRKVDAIKNGTLEKTGDWDGDANTGTITSNFVNVTRPLILLNGVWQIRDGGLTFVVASQVVNGELLSLRLEKI